MTTIDRINALVQYCMVIDSTPKVSCSDDLHSVLNSIDFKLGVDTEWLSALECSCPYHIGKMCHNRRPVGARVALLEGRVAQIIAGERYEEEIRRLQDDYGVGLALI